MDVKVKESVAALLAYIIKVDHRDVEKVTPLFCNIMGEDFACDIEGSKKYLHKMLEKELEMDKHIQIIKKALSQDKLSRYHILEQLNHMIYSDTIQPNDYLFFEKIKKELFPEAK